MSSRVQFVRCMLWLVALFLALSANAQTLYQADAPVADQSATARSVAVGEALVQVAAKVSGRSEAAGNNTVIAAKRSAESLMQRYEYRQELVRPAPGQPPIARLLLRATFYPQSIESLLARAGLPSWGAEKPQVLAFILYDDALVNSATGADLVRRGAERGISIVFPQAETVLVEQIKGADFSSLVTRGKNIGARAVLIGELGSIGSFSGKFSVRDANNNEPLEIRAADLKAAFTSLADQSSVIVAGLFAGTISSAPVELLATIHGIDSAADYSRVMSYLSGLNVVKKMRVSGAQADSLSVQMTVIGGVDRLATSLATGKILDLTPLVGDATQDTVDLQLR
jgi:uncharacterized protein